MKRLLTAILGLLLLCGNASAVGILPAIVGSSLDATWANWNEELGQNLKNDQDGDGTDDTAIWVFENATTGGNEVGRAGSMLTGDGLYLEQSGNVAGCTTTPSSYRITDGTDDYFLFRDSATGASTVPTATTTWTVIVKTDRINTGNNWSESLLNFQGANDRISINTSYPDQAFFRVSHDGTAYLSTLTNAIPNYTSPIYWVVCNDGTSIMAGYAENTKPTKFTQLTSGVSTAMTGLQYDAADFGTFARMFWADDGSHYLKGLMRYVVLSKKALISNN